MTGLLFVTARSTDVKDLNRILLYLRDWDVSSTTDSTQTQQFLDRFRFVTKHNPRALVTNSHRRSSASSTGSSTTPTYEAHQAHGTFPPVPPSATFVNSWVGRGVEEIEGFMDMLAKDVHQEKKSLNNINMHDTLERRDSGYSTSSEDNDAAISSSSAENSYNADMYLVVDEVGLATGTATLGCRRGGSTSTTSWDRVRGVPWTEVCSVWKTIQKTKSVDSLFSGGIQAQKLGMLDAHASRELNYQIPLGGGDAGQLSADCRRRDMEVSMWRECGLV